MKARAKPKNPEPPGVVVPPGVDALLTPAQVAAALACDLRTFRRLISGGEFPAPTGPPGKKPRWPTSVVNAYIWEKYGGQRVS